ncbi:MAG TPA: SigE family RNA polymerase sigma factor [Nocardioidaceae bacterium]|nr:SigE family RNA polymerase sigma factor [Nocardioidaceae bacterium]
MARDDAEFTAFVVARRPHLRRVAFALCGDWHAADDLVQTALAKLYVAWPRMRKVDSAEAYARRVIVRAIVDESRRPWRREHATQALPEAATHDVIGEHDDVVAALQLLPSMQRRCVVMRHWLDLSVEETARELGISSGTVKSHTSRALTRLNELLADEERSAP